MARIYTKGGDRGKTGIHGGERVDKDDIRIEVNGTIDELNSVIGLVRALITETLEKRVKVADGEGERQESQEIIYAVEYLSEPLKKIQTELMSVMSIIATPDLKRKDNPNKFGKEMCSYCEILIDNFSAEIGDNSHFLLPGGTVISAQLHIARTIARRAERRLCSLNRVDRVPEEVAIFLNRLSDLLFVMARFSVLTVGCDEERWKSFRYMKDNK
jgi:cob(I)alamin adenosyltransferase